MYSILLQASFLEHFMDNLTEKSIVYSILLLVVGYLGWRLHNKEAELKELQKSIRENEKDNLNILIQVNATLDRVIEGQRTTNEMVFRELHNLKDFIKYIIENASLGTRKKK